jgi:DNA-binding MarR family transcriptional regulator
MAELFTPLERAAWGGFIATQSRLFQRIEDDLRRRFGITHAEFEVLLRLSFARDGRARIQDLAAKSLLSRSGTSRAVERLARAGHVAREGAEEDGRGAYAVLTDEGRAHFFAAAKDHVALVRKEFLSHLTGEEMRSLAAIWRRIGDGDTEPPAASGSAKARTLPRPKSPRRGSTP